MHIPVCLCICVSECGCLCIVHMCLHLQICKEPGLLASELLIRLMKQSLSKLKLTKLYQFLYIENKSMNFLCTENRMKLHMEYTHYRQLKSVSPSMKSNN